METVFILLIAFSVLHYAVALYGSMVRKLVGYVIRLAERRNTFLGERKGASIEQPGQGWQEPGGRGHGR